MSLRARLQRQLKEKLITENIKLREIAIATGISKATLSRIARGKTPTLAVYQKLNNYLNPDQNQPEGEWSYFVGYLSGGRFCNSFFKTREPWDSGKKIRSWEEKQEKEDNVKVVLVLNWKLLNAPK